MTKKEANQIVKEIIEDYKADLLKKIEEMKKTSGSEFAPERVIGKTAYNQALEDIKQLLK